MNVNMSQHYIKQFDSLHFKNWHSLFRLVHKYGLDDLGFDSPEVQAISLFTQSALTSLQCVFGLPCWKRSGWKQALLSVYAFMSCIGTILPLHLPLPLLLFTSRFEKNRQVFKQEINVNIRAVHLSLLQPTSQQQALFSLSTNVMRFMEN
jgi:hypothetical protein